MIFIYNRKGGAADSGRNSQASRKAPRKRCFSHSHTAKQRQYLPAPELLSDAAAQLFRLRG